MTVPRLYTQAGQILAFLDSERGAGLWTAADLAWELKRSLPQTITACSAQYLEGRIARVTVNGVAKYMAVPHYPQMPKPCNPSRAPLVACLGVRVAAPC